MKNEWAVIVMPSADKRIASLPKPERERIRAEINGLVTGPYDRTRDIKRLFGRPEWRLRVGQWRVLFLADGERIIITVVSVSARGDAYK